jgi:hypothetical protein
MEECGFIIPWKWIIKAKTGNKKENDEANYQYVDVIKV